MRDWVEVFFSEVCTFMVMVTVFCGIAAAIGGAIGVFVGAVIFLARLVGGL